MRGGCAAHGADAGDVRCVLRQQLRRQEVLRDQDRAVRQLRGRRFFRAGEQLEQLQFEIAQVVHARGEMGIRQRFKRPDGIAHGAAPGKSGALARRNLRMGIGKQIRIVEEFEMRAEDFGACAGARSREPGQACAQAFACIIQPVQFLARAAPGFRHDGFGVHQPGGLAQREARSGGDAGQTAGRRACQRRHCRRWRWRWRTGAQAHRLRERALELPECQGRIGARCAHRQPVPMRSAERHDGDGAFRIRAAIAERQHDLGLQVPEALCNHRGRACV